jgi:16S rRNA (cytidine1402-2'-O)-methyltransferase
LSPNNVQQVIPEQVKEVIKTMDVYFVEEVRTARRFISAQRLGLTIENLIFEVLDKKTRREDALTYFKKHKGKKIGVISEAGCPGVADPGAEAVKIAHEKNIKVIPLVGPSSIIMALMASGFNGQRFSFQGYLPIDRKDREKQISLFENRAKQNREAQIFIETPYRNNQLLESFIKTCSKSTMLCVVKNVTGENEQIIMKSIEDWASIKIDLHKIPTVFLIQ